MCIRAQPTKSTCGVVIQIAEYARRFLVTIKYPRPVTARTAADNRNVATSTPGTTVSHPTAPMMTLSAKPAAKTNGVALNMALKGF
jgi:hypothetical protein